jgi:hypothetical protein
LPLWLSAGENASLFDNRFPSARASGMGGAQTAVAGDVWAAYYNPAGLVLLDNNYNFGAAYYKPYNGDFFDAVFGSFAMKLPEKFGALSVTYQKFGVEYEGTELSNESTFGISHGFYLLKDIHTSLSFGYSLKGYYWGLGQSVSGIELGSQTVFGMDIAMQANLYRRTWIGFYALNINNPKIGTDKEVDLPRRFVVGIGYEPYAGVTTSIDFNQVDGEDMQIFGGLEYQVLDELALRFGLATNPNIFTAGLGINYNGFRFDYAFKSHPVLDVTHYFTLSYGF